MDPKRMYKIGGKEVDDFRIGFVSLKEDKVLDTLPFYACIRALSAYVRDTKEPYVLLKGMSHEEMTGLIQDVRAEIQAGQNLRKAFEKNLKFISHDQISAETVKAAFSQETVVFENVYYPSGMIIAADPICYLQDEKSVHVLAERINPGRYPVILSIIHPSYDSVRIAGMKLKITDRQAVSYTLAENADKKSFSGFPVDTGTCAFCDQAAAVSYWKFLDQWYAENPKGNFYDDYLADLFARSCKDYPTQQRPGGDFIRFRIPETEHEMIMCATGFGDGYYSAYWGKDSDGNICELVSVFIDPQLYGDI